MVFAFCCTDILAQKIKLVGTTWKISECICDGGDNSWFDGGKITFLKNGKTNNSDQRWKLIGNVIKVTTTDKYGREFTGEIRGNQMTGILYEGMNKRAIRFNAVKQ